jgi:hypothetical protein
MFDRLIRRIVFRIVVERAQDRAVSDAMILPYDANPRPDGLFGNDKLPASLFTVPLVYTRLRLSLALSACASLSSGRFN